MASFVSFQPLPLDNDLSTKVPPPWFRGRAAGMDEKEIAIYHSQQAQDMFNQAVGLIRQSAEEHPNTSCLDQAFATLASLQPYFDEHDADPKAPPLMNKEMRQLEIIRAIAALRPFSFKAMAWLVDQAGWNLQLNDSLTLSPNDCYNTAWPWNWSSGETWQFLLDHVAHDQACQRALVVRMLGSLCHDRFFSSSIDIGYRKESVVLQACKQHGLDFKTLTATHWPQDWGDRFGRGLQHDIGHRNEAGIDLLLATPDFLVPQALNNVIADLDKPTLLWFQDMLDKHPAWRAAIDSIYPLTVKRPFGYLGYGAERHAKYVFGDENHLTQMETVCCGYLGHLILRGNRVVNDLVHSEEGRSAILDAALDHPRVLWALLNQDNIFHLDVCHLLAWDRDRVLAWRDDKGCCVGHYALYNKASAQATFDALLTRVINVAPEWKNVTRHDGVELIQLFHSSEKRAIASRKQLKEEIRATLMGDEHQPKKAAKTRRRM